MDIRVRAQNAFRIAQRFNVFRGGAMRPARRVIMRIGGIWETVFLGAPSMAITFSPPVLNAFAPSFSVVTRSAAATVTGGTAPYVYSWAVTSFSNGVTPTISNPSIAAPSFSQRFVISGDPSEAEFTLTITDATGQVAQNVLFATFTNTL